VLKLPNSGSIGGINIWYLVAWLLPWVFVRPNLLIRLHGGSELIARRAVCKQTKAFTGIKKVVHLSKKMLELSVRKSLNTKTWGVQGNPGQQYVFD
jgi:hypothetical protein